MAENRFDKALIYYKKYLNKTKEHKASTLVSIASVYNELDNKQKAIEYLGSAIKISKEPKLSWYEMLLGLYYNIADYTNSIITQESIIEKFGTNKKQLMTLVGLYQLVQNQQKALSTLELAYDMGYFDKEDDFVQLSYLWLNHGTPEKSARMLQKAIDKSLLKSNQTILKLLADSYSSARESSKALNTYKKLATLSQNGNIYAQIAQTYLEIENYHEAILFFTKAIESEDIKNIGGAYLLRGISYYNISNSTKARADFIKAKNYNKSAKNAQQWLKFI
jgi:tetratricopeptide (TPR) repeat protein